MKVLQVNSVYNRGSTGKIVYDIHSELKNRGIDSVVCYGRGEKVKEDGVYKVCGELYSKINHFKAKITGVLYGGCYFSTNKLCHIIKKEKPDVVHLHCINGYFVNIYRLIAWLKKKNIKTIITLHAEFIYTGNCGCAFECEKWKTGCGKCPRNKSEIGSYLIDSTHYSWLKMKKSFAGFEKLYVLSVSPWLMNRAKESPVLSTANHSFVLNGIETNIFKTYNDNLFQSQKSQSGEKIIFHATPNFNADPNHNKGGYYVLKIAKDLQNENIKFIVAGDYTPGLKVPSNVTLLGKVTNQKSLSKHYALADATLLTSKRETFSMVTAESLCCGTPVVGFNAGAPEEITIAEFSSFVQYGDLSALKNAILDMMNRKFDKERISRIAKEKYDKNKMIERYLMFYENKG